MIYTKIAPLGERPGPGSYDGFWNMEKYKSMEEAMSAGDFVTIDFVQDERQIIYFEFFHSKRPKIRLHYQLGWQRFPAGVDTRDDAAAIEIARTMLADWPTEENIPERAYDSWLHDVRVMAYKQIPPDGVYICPDCGSKNVKMIAIMSEVGKVGCVMIVSV
jgi:hypothetical protein